MLPWDKLRRSLSTRISCAPNVHSTGQMLLIDIYMCTSTIIRTSDNQQRAERPWHVRFWGGLTRVKHISTSFMLHIHMQWFDKHEFSKHNMHENYFNIIYVTCWYVSTYTIRGWLITIMIYSLIIYMINKTCACSGLNILCRLLSEYLQSIIICSHSMQNAQIMPTR